jgi:hypothetical protein
MLLSMTSVPAIASTRSLSPIRPVPAVEHELLEGARGDEHLARVASRLRRVEQVRDGDQHRPERAPHHEHE